MLAQPFTPVSADELQRFAAAVQVLANHHKPLLVTLTMCVPAWHASSVQLSKDM